MPRTTITNSQLLALRDDILHQNNTSAAFFFFNHARVQRFFGQNQMALKVLKSRMDEFVTKYVKHDENNQPCTEEVKGSLNYQFETDENKEAYVKGVNHFLSLKVTIEI